LIIYILIGVALVLVVLGLSSARNAPSELPISELAAAIKRDPSAIKNIRVGLNEIQVIYGNGTTQISRKSSTSSLEEQLIALNVPKETIPQLRIEYVAPSDWTPALQIIFSLLPLLIIAAFFWMMIRQTQGSNNQALSFGKSRARMFTGDQPTVTFDDVAGADEAKEDLKEVVEFLKEPEKFIQLGARIPKGVLLVGHPGTGKTLLAKAVSGEAGVPFFSISGSEFVEMFVGVGASRVRDLFEQAKRHSPCIIFVDEIDAVGRQRGAGLGGSHDEREQTLNQILVEMDGFDTDTNVIIIAATNRPDILDPALLRPGRFDRRVILDKPDVKGREAILKVHTRGKPLSSDVDLAVIARSTPGLAGADLENMVNEGAIVAARKNKKTIAMRDLEEALERVLLGPERKSRIISDAEKRMIAYHEAGHAVVMHMLPKCDPVRKVTIVARGMAGGVTWSMPEDDNMSKTAGEFEDMLSGLLGGRVAEEIVFSEVTTGASNDLERVTRIARSMIMRWGMSDKLGPRVFGQKEEMVFLGRDFGEQRDYSESVAEAIDEEVNRLVTQAHERARQILTEYREKLETVTNRLLEVETLSREEFLEIMGGRPQIAPRYQPKQATSPGEVRDGGNDAPPRLIPGMAN
jgi:cell division protease FtsH